MKTYAIIKSGIVDNCIVLNDDTDPSAFAPPGHVPVDLAGRMAGPGSLYVDGVFSDPPPPAPPLKRAWSPNEFRARLTLSEQTALDGVIMEGMTGADATARAWAIQFLSARDLSLDDPRYAQGLALLVAKNVITAARRDELMQPD